ncbi:MAG: hypothetical protein HYY18_21600 [Planctomycetes bacterium]|nr:hypothetical protein [Planctomycetota bacterium]
MKSTVLPLTRSLGPLEILDAAVWFARDHFAAWAVTAAAAPLAFALALTGYVTACLRLADAPGRDAASNLIVHGGAAIVAALFVARGLSHAAAIEFVRAEVYGERRTPEGCWLPALRRAADHAFFVGGLSVIQWLGLAAGIYPGLAWLNTNGLAQSAAIFEDLPAPRALRRSRELMKGNIAGMGVWAGLFLAWLVLFANALCFGAFMPDIVRSFLGLSFPRIEHLISPRNGTFVMMSAACTWALTDALRAVAFAILYMNARIEREGSDLHARLEHGSERRRVERPEAAHA